MTTKSGGPAQSADVGAAHKSNVAPDSIARIVRRKNVALARAAIEVLKAEHPATLRQIFYQLVSRGVLPSTAKPHYARLGGVLTRLREAGAVPFEWIVDHVRATLKPSSWSGLADFSETVRGAYRKDFWAELPVCVEVFSEKDAISGTVQPVTAEYDTALRVVRGYCSISFVGEIAAEWRQINKPIHAYYLGDFDPSGLDIERDLVAKLARYSGRECLEGCDAWPFCLPAFAPGPSEFGWTRLAVNADDIDAFDLLPLAVKHSDRRAAGFLEEHGQRCVEVDALPPTELRRRVEEAITRHIDADAWQRLRTIEEAEQETVAAVAAKLARKKVNLDSLSGGAP